MEPDRDLRVKFEQYFSKKTIELEIYVYKIQNALQCCGLHSYKDYNPTSGEYSLPVSCCNNFFPNDGCLAKDALTVGCWEKYLFMFEDAKMYNITLKGRGLFVCLLTFVLSIYFFLELDD